MLSEYWNKNFPPSGSTKQQAALALLSQINSIAQLHYSSLPTHGCPPLLPAFAITGENAVSHRLPSSHSAQRHYSDVAAPRKPTAQHSQNSSGSPSATAGHCARPRSRTLTNVTATTNTHVRRRGNSAFARPRHR